MISPAERAAYAALLERQAAEWQPPLVGLVALSLSYHVPISADRIRYDLSRFHTQLDKSLLGRRFYKRKPDERSRFWAVIESTTKIDGAIGPVHRHVHCGWKMPPPFGLEDLRGILERGLWLRFAGHGTYDAQAFRFRSDVDIGWGYYSTKFLTEPDGILYSADFLR